MYTKIEITGTIELVTGTHIGGSTAFAAIGAVDSPIVRDALDGKPMIPGSTLKGKMRTLLSKSIQGMTSKPDDDGEHICRMFGSTGMKGCLAFSDTFLENEKELKAIGVPSATEVKFENTINRASGIANPRQIERVIRGAKFPLSLMYELSNQNDQSDEECQVQLMNDIQLISDGIKLLEYDYIGGSGSRGYGRIKINNLDVNVKIGELDDNLLEQCRKIIGTN